MIYKHSTNKCSTLYAHDRRTDGFLRKNWTRYIDQTVSIKYDVPGTLHQLVIKNDILKSAGEDEAHAYLAALPVRKQL